MTDKKVWLITGAALSHLLAGRRGGPAPVADIVNISSIAGRETYETPRMTDVCGVVNA